LGQLQEIESGLIELGYQIVAASADKSEKLSETTTELNLSYRLVSDASADGAKAFGLAFRVDDKTNQKYQGYGIDLEKASGESHHILPVPAVYLFETDGTITFSYVNPNYRVRLAPGLLLKAAQIDSEKRKRE
jgi:peroxiredoxin